MRGRDRPFADARALVDVEYLVVWLVALVAIAGVAGAVASYGDDVRTTTPDSAFVLSFDEETRTVTVAHDGGDAIRDRHTSELTVVVADASTNATERIAWAEDEGWFTDRGMGFPVTEGETFTVDDPTVDADGDGSYHDADATVGFRLSGNDTVRVEWTGERRGGSTTTKTLLNARVVRSDAGTIRFEVDGN